MKKYILILFLTVFVVPSIALAAWWNPLTWWGVSSTPSTSSIQNNNIVIPTGWKIYNNTNYNYQIAYPSNLPTSPEINNSSMDQVSFGNGGLNFSIRITKNSMSPDQEVKSELTNLPSGASTAGYTYSDQTSDFTAGGLKGKKIAINYLNKDGTPSHTLVNSYINKGGESIWFGCFYEPNTNLPANIAKYVKTEDLGVEYGYNCSTFDKMISTFKFTK